MTQQAPTILDRKEFARSPEPFRRAFGLAVLAATRTGIARIVVFGDPGLVTRWGFAPGP